jgi:UDP-N-acetylglucosamine 2-epimerase (non-hydrolysing)
VDELSKLKKIIGAIETGIGNNKAVFPVHPRTAKILAGENWTSEKIILAEPMSYLEFMYLLENAAGVITDSGGVQEETTVLGIPCITLRSNTERPETISVGTNELIGDDVDKLISTLDKIKSGTTKKGRVPDLWDGKTAERIVNVLTTL